MVKLKKLEKDAFIRAIDDDYRVHWIVDNLPVGVYATNDLKESVFTRGFPVGFRTGTLGRWKHYLYNHIRIILQYHDDAEGSNAEEVTTKIVGFRVEPMSIKHNFEGTNYIPGTTVLTTCNAMTPPVHDLKTFQSVDKLDNIIFTYDVFWEKSNVEWSSRWDLYLNANNPNDKVHWFSIINAIMVVLLLSVLIAIILLRTLRKDIAKYNDPASIEEATEESGWKLVHGDVFRPPATAPLLFRYIPVYFYVSLSRLIYCSLYGFSVFVGTGVQLFLMVVATLSFALLGLLSPANRGSLVTAIILLFVFMGFFGGYQSAVTYKMFRGTEWKQNTIATAFGYPGTIFSIFFVLNLILWFEGSSGAIPFSTFFTLLFLFFCVSMPLVFIGSFFGYKKEAITFPVRTNQIPRAIPLQPWYMNPIILCMLGGILPFGAVSVELYFIMSALWLHQIYYIFGFLFLVMIVLIITCAETAILLCYLQLCSEDYHWWWRSFLASGSCSFYTILYAIWYNMTELDMHGFVPLVIYLGYMFALSFSFFLITGTIGFFACFWFNTTIYGSIKVD